ncbi:MAG: ABC transporter permease, partial [Candidatus Nanopelagicaceae bacterium]
MARKSKNVEIVNDANENAILNKETEGLSQGQIVLRRFIRHRAAMISVVVLFTLITVVYTS